ncbi:LysR family transcriptional regulator [Kaarinaea lacus]
MDLNQMLIFGKVAEKQSFTKASEELGMEKSTVSMKISQLEERLGTRLLNRTTRSVTLTEAGEGYYHYCQQVIDTAKEAEHFAETLSSEPQGLLRITSPVDFGQIFVSTLIDPFLKKHPKVQIDLVLRNPPVDIIDERIDIALMPNFGGLQDSSLVARKILETDLGVYASPAYIKRHGKPETIEDIDDHDYIGFRYGSKWSIPVTRKNAKYVIEPKARISINDVLSCKQAARDGLGLAIIPGRIAEQDVKSRKLVQLLTNYSFPTVTLYATYASRQWMPTKLKAFLEHLETWK